MAGKHQFNGVYEGGNLNHVAFPLGGVGAGMICLEGTGALSHMSFRNAPDVFSEPYIYSALCVKGRQNVARVLEGPVQKRKYFGAAGTGNGTSGRTYGFPRFDSSNFRARFPFGTVELKSKDVPLKVSLTDGVRSRPVTPTPPVCQSRLWNTLLKTSPRGESRRYTPSTPETRCRPATRN